MKIDLEAAQAEIDEYIILLDLKSEECDEWKARARVLEAALIDERLNRNYPIAGLLSEG